MRLIVGVALDERAKTTVSVADNGDSVYLRNGGHLLRIPAELVPTLASEFVRVDAELKMAAEVAKPIGPSHEPPFDVAKAIDAEEVWDSDDRPWHIVSAAAVAKDDVIFDHGKWVTVVNKVPSDSAVLLTFDNDRTAYLPKSTAVRLADKVVHPDPCGGGDLPEPGRSFDVV